MMHGMAAVGRAALVLLLVWCGAARGQMELSAGDRVVLLGGTFLEREGRDAYIETALTSYWPDRHITFRNMGWSGDTAALDAWSYPASNSHIGHPGYRLLHELLTEYKPTVIAVQYGSAEAFEGDAGLDKFTTNLNRLLDELAGTSAKLVLVTPVPHERVPGGSVDPEPYNTKLARYCDAIRAVAQERNLPVVDLFSVFHAAQNATNPPALTDNGVHLTATGYRRAADLVRQSLGLAPNEWRVEISGVEGIIREPVGTRIEHMTATSRHRVVMTLRDDRLPDPPSPGDDTSAADPLVRRTLIVRDLAPGNYTLRIDEQPVATASAQAWAAGVTIARGPEFDQAEALRQAVAEKNLTWFHRWRPQNETYLYGFRKYEQGQNAAEIPLFNPLIEKQERRIAELRVPVSRRYELTRVDEER